MLEKGKVNKTNNGNFVQIKKNRSYLIKSCKFVDQTHGGFLFQLSTFLLSRNWNISYKRYIRSPTLWRGQHLLDPGQGWRWTRILIRGRSRVVMSASSITTSHTSVFSHVLLTSTLVTGRVTCPLTIHGLARTAVLMMNTSCSRETVVGRAVWSDGGHGMGWVDHDRSCRCWGWGRTILVH